MEVGATPESPDFGAPRNRIAPVRLGIATVVATTIIAVISAIPTSIIENPWFTRMTPVYANQYFFWIATSIVGGGLLATYLEPMTRSRGLGKGLGGGLLGYLAIGCPICNKVIVTLLGVSGALNFFAPIQPLLGAIGLALVSVALLFRARDLRRASCPVPAA